MNLELVTIGDELLLGFTIDTNAAHLARELAALGVAIVRRATVGDDAADIVVRGARGARSHRRGDHDRRTRSDGDDLTQARDRRAVRPRPVPDEERWEELRALWKERWHAARSRREPGADHDSRGREVLENRHGYGARHLARG